MSASDGSITIEQFTLAAYVLAGVASLISFIHIFRHLCNYSMPEIQTYVIRIIFICPIFAISSALALAFIDSAAYILVVRDIYEAVVVYSFLNLILEFCGGETDCVYLMENEAPLTMPCPLCFLPAMSRDLIFLRFCCRGVLQFVVVKPFVSILDIVLIATGHEFDPIWQTIQLVIYNASYGFALYCLFVFYLATKKIIKNFRPILKFAAVKVIIFATYYQSLLVTLASQRADGSNFTAIDAIRWNNLLLCGEMVIFAVGLLVAFPIKEFIGGIPDRRLLSNVKDVFAVDDVLQNMYTNFNPTYRDYALQRSQAEAPDMGRLNNTFGGSNLSSVAMEMTGVYRGKSKRLAFNSLLRGEQPIKAKLRSSHNSALSTTGLLHEYNDHLYTQSSYRRRSLSGVSNGSVIDNPILEHSSSLPPELMVIRALTSDSVESPLERGRGYTNDGNNEGDCEEGIENDADDDDEEEIYLTPSSPRQLSASSSSSSIIATSIPAPKFRVNLNLAKKVGSKDKLKMTPPRVTAVTSSDTNLFRANSGSDISGVSIFFPSPPGNSSVVNTADPTTAAPIYSSNNSISNNHDSYIDKSNEPTESKEVELLQEKANPNPTEFGMSPAQLERADTVGSGDDSWGEFEACHSSKSDSTVK